MKLFWFIAALAVAQEEVDDLGNKKNKVDKVRDLTKRKPGLIKSSTGTT